MNWTQAAHVIAERIVKRHNIEVSDALVEAVIEGFRYECDAWVHKSK